MSPVVAGHLLPSLRKPHFKAEKWSWNGKKNMAMDLKLRMAALAKASNKFLLFFVLECSFELYCIYIF
jgi:hypothetical protein